MEKVEDGSDLAVQNRREWLAEKYFAGVTPQALWREYKTVFGLSKHSFDKDVTFARQQAGVALRANFDDIVDDQYTILMNMMENAVATGNTTTALRCQKQITDLLKLVNTKTKAVVTLNQQINNNNLPEMTIDMIKEMLGRSIPKTVVIPVESSVSTD